MCSVILPSNVSWQQRLISPVWGFRPLHHVADDVRELSVATLRYSSYDGPVPNLDPAKLPYCYSNVIGAAFSALVLPCRPNTPLPSRNSGTVIKSSTALSCDSDGEGPGTRIYWSFCREMYHCNEKCEVLIAAASPNGHIRCRDNCQICQPETEPLLVVTSTGSKYHCSGCRTTEKS